MIKLYGFGPTRSARVEWVLKELGLRYELVDGRSLMGTDEYKRIHPLGKLPAVEHNGKVLFESTAIVTYFADMYPERGLTPKHGTYERALYDQWTSFASTELESWIWSNAKHTILYPEERRVPAIVEPNTQELRTSAKVIDDLLASRDYILGDEFTAADINVGYVLNWGRCNGTLGETRHIGPYLDRLHERPHNMLVAQTEFFTRAAG